MEKLVRETFLEMTKASRATSLSAEGRLDIRQAEIACPDTSRFFYTAIGAEWGWYDRLGWNRERWLAHASRPDLCTWIGFQRGSPAGYFELVSHPNFETEILSFGLLPSFIGCGLGQELLAAAIELAWKEESSRIWLSTCSLDHPRALPNYQAAGFKIFKTIEALRELPDHPSGFWPASPQPLGEV
jgi:ribosomal protein S18 acetylase RimI-like enzyme